METIQLSNTLNNDNNNKKNDDKMVKYSFYITYAFLLTTATITFIEAMRNKDTRIRNVLNLETCISIVAAFFYGMFMKKMNESNIDYKSINTNRYVDWSITTPIMLWVLLLAFNYNSKKKITVSNFLIVLLLNYGMLGSGFLGETNKVNKVGANVVGFAFFIGLYYFIYHNYIRKYKIFDNKLLYWVFVVFWSLYGVAYWLDEKEKNVMYNVLDLFSKCFVGIFFWAYFTKTLVLKG